MITKTNAQIGPAVGPVADTVSDAVISGAIGNKANLTSAGGNITALVAGDLIFFKSGWVNSANFGPCIVVSEETANEDYVIRKLDTDGGANFVNEAAVSVVLQVARGLVKCDSAALSLYCNANVLAFSTLVNVSMDGKNFVDSGVSAITALGMTVIPGAIVWAYLAAGTIGTSLDTSWAWEDHLRT